MKVLRRSWFQILGMAACMVVLAMGSLVWACDIAVVAARANPEGRPLIWKNYDDSKNGKRRLSTILVAAMAGNAYFVAP